LTRSPVGIVAKFRWIEGNPEARSVRAVFEAGALGASVEFVPVETPQPNKAGGYHFPKTLLTGWALTGNPANLDCVRLVKSLGLVGADDVGLELAEPEGSQAAVDPTAVQTGLREVIAAQVHREVLLQMFGMTGAAAEEPALIVVADGSDDPDVAFIDPEGFREAWDAVLKETVTEEARRQVLYMRGRID
jgi:hypothetical protein